MITPEQSTAGLKDIAERFHVYGDYVHGKPHGSGHINDTYLLTFNQGGNPVKFVLQRLNHHIFKDPNAVMENIERVSTHIRQKLNGTADASRRALIIIPTLDGAWLHHDAKGNYWRMFVHIEKAETYDVIGSPDQAFQAAKAFGEFQMRLVDLPGGRLRDTIPDFHNTPKRLNALEEVVKNDPVGRAAATRREIDALLGRGEMAGHLLAMNAEGRIPERITHNDTKLNNVMIDEESGEGICIIDLDTVMSGFVNYDFGDLVRTCCCSAWEDERDLSKIVLNLEMFEALAKGYLSTAGGFLTEAERAHLAFGGKLITYELAMRFLADHLAGDVYFKIHREGHNLDRCRAQLRLVEEIERCEPEMRAIAAALR